MGANVAVVVPIFKTELSADERLSLAQLARWLGGYPCVQLSPTSLTAKVVGGEVRHFPDGCFAGKAPYNRLLLSREFYGAFLDFEYILIYQTDCLAFSDALGEFVQLGVDYLGAPWVLFDRSSGPRLGRAGNGGLSLRRVRRFLDVLDARGAFAFPAGELRRHFGAMRFFSRFDDLRIRALASCHVPQLGAAVARAWIGNEDVFWAFIAPALLKEFVSASWAEGVRFSFEEAPRLCFSLNQCRLPFGCHAWRRWDPEFWQSVLASLRA